MEVLTVKTDEEIVNALRHFVEWVSLSQIAKALELTHNKATRICWSLVGKGLLLWKPDPARREKQLFKYNYGYGKKKQTDIFNEIHKLLQRNYYITGEAALFLHNLTNHALYQRIIEIALPTNKYNEIGSNLVENLNAYATIIPYTLPKQTNKDIIIADALGIGDVIILRKALHNPRQLRFYGNYNLPSKEIILEEVELPVNSFFEYTLKAIDLGLTEEEFEELCQKKPVLIYLKRYLEGDKDIPDSILDALKAAERSVRGY